MDELIAQIKENLTILNLPKWEVMDNKTQKRLLSIQEYSNNKNKRIEELVSEIKDQLLNKSTIANAISISRKTLYHPVLNTYSEYLIKEQKDVFNDKSVADLKKQLNAIEEQYNKVLLHTIDTYELKEQIKILKREITEKTNENRDLEDLINEKNKIITELKRNSIINNVIPIK